MMETETGFREEGPIEPRDLLLEFPEVEDAKDLQTGTNLDFRGNLSVSYAPSVAQTDF